MKSIFKNMSSIIDDINTGDGTRELNELLGNGIFQFPKPSALIRRLIEQVLDKDDIVLDFFAGSGTTAQAVIEWNQEDGGQRKFICVQLPEPLATDSAASQMGMKTIADIGKERIRKVIKRLSASHNPELPLTKNREQGFRVFKLKQSHFKLWDGNTAQENIKDIEKQLSLHIHHVSPDSTEEGVLYELLIKSGFPIATKVERMDIAGKTIFSVAQGAMLLSLDKKLTIEVIREMAKLKPSRVVCLDDGFQGNDSLKTNAVQTMKANNVEHFFTV
jgi:adenine-specific DNA-methyltransferase